MFPLSYRSGPVDTSGNSVHNRNCMGNGNELPLPSAVREMNTVTKPLKVISAPGAVGDTFMRTTEAQPTLPGRPRPVDTSRVTLVDLGYRNGLWLVVTHASVVASASHSALAPREKT